MQPTCSTWLRITNLWCWRISISWKNRARFRAIKPGWHKVVIQPPKMRILRQFTERERVLMYSMDVLDTIVVYVHGRAGTLIFFVRARWTTRGNENLCTQRSMYSVSHTYRMVGISRCNHVDRMPINMAPPSSRWRCRVSFLWCASHVLAIRHTYSILRSHTWLMLEWFRLAGTSSMLLE